MTTAEQGNESSIDEVYISLAGALLVWWPLLVTSPMNLASSVVDWRLL